MGAEPAESLRLHSRGLFSRIARKRGGWTGWTYYAVDRSRDGHLVVGIGRTAQEAINLLMTERKP